MPKHPTHEEMFEDLREVILQDLDVRDMYQNDAEFHAGLDMFLRTVPHFLESAVEQSRRRIEIQKRMIEEIRRGL